MTLAPALFTAPIAGLVPIDVDVANQLLIRWNHELGPCDRLAQINRLLAVAIKLSRVE